jgi:hypothetical protein
MNLKLPGAPGTGWRRVAQPGTPGTGRSTMIEFAVQCQGSKHHRP